MRAALLAGPSMTPVHGVVNMVDDRVNFGRPRAFGKPLLTDHVDQMAVMLMVRIGSVPPICVLGHSRVLESRYMQSHAFHVPVPCT